MIEYFMVWYDKITKPIKKQTKAEFREDYDPSLPISKCFKRVKDAVQLTDDAEFFMATRTNTSVEIQSNEKMRHLQG